MGVGAANNRWLSSLICPDIFREEQISLEESHFTYSSGMLPSLGARTNHKTKLRRYIISPYDPRYRAWETFLIVLAIYSAWVSPFEFAFIEEPRGLLLAADLIVNVIFSFAIFLTFFVAYLDRTTYLLIDDHKSIAKRYICTWFTFDMFDILSSTFDKKPTSLSCGILIMLRLWPLKRVSALFARLEKDIRFNYFWTRCVKLICVTLFAVHCAGCFNYLLAARYRDGRRTWIGTVIPEFKEKVSGFAMLLQFTGLTAYLIGNMTNLVVHGTTRTMRFRDTIQAASRFGFRNRLPEHLQDQMLAHLCLKFRTEGLQQQQTLDDLPKANRSSIANHLFFPIVEKVYLFKNVSNDFLFQLVTEMKAEYYPPKQDVILQNEAPTDFYILVYGAMELIEANQLLNQLFPGDVFGEIGVLCYRPQPYTVRTKKLSQLLRLNRSSFMNIVQSNIGDGTTIMNNLLQHLKERQDPSSVKFYRETEELLSRGRMDVPVSLCFVASRGDSLLMEQLLRRGMDPNEPGNNSRTPLHIATANGHKQCVRILLACGADVNSKDGDGSVPLWEAIIGRHGSIAKLLREHGASLKSGDVVSFIREAAKLGNEEILNDLIRYGADINATNEEESTALHLVTDDGSTEAVKCLLKHEADIHKVDANGLTPKAIAKQKEHEDIVALFEEKSHSIDSHLYIPVKESPVVSCPHEQNYREITNPSESLEEIRINSCSNSPTGMERRKRANSFDNSLFGIVTMRSNSNLSFGGKSFNARRGVPTSSSPRIRVTIRRYHPLWGKTSRQSGKLILLPDSIQELLRIGGQKYDFSPVKVLSEECAEIDDINVITDGDNLFLVDDDEPEKTPTNGDQGKP